MKNLRPLIGALSATAIALSGATAAHAQDKPYATKPITLVVPFAAGGAADQLARVLSQSIGTKLGQPIVVDPKSGAGGTIGAAVVARAEADGHTLLLVTAGHAGTGELYKSLPYHPVNGFAPVIGLAVSPVVIATNAKSKYKTLQDLVADAKARPGVLNCAGGGGGATVTNLAFEQFKSELKLNIASVPYRGSAPATTALLSGEIDCNSDAVASFLPQIKAGNFRALAVTTAKRSTFLPDVPTVAETVLPKFDAAAWYGILAPKGTPQPVVDQLNRAFGEALNDPAVKERLAGLGAESTGLSAADFGKFMAAETERWSALIRKLGLKAE
ncbi:Bug family tripartite tricarboxylate transporter substrate binding protein [Hydrogenophaga sp. BPS33]|uniref:Bug family tripartite tricarboxylate transporter substrate binding protein n=1 Tax=Hydrogenophaga sp. BPS33 TaxID=2651974 RepID=UPI0013204D44|nr:tripartite tricarboxylate transporter substrate binding protein [Hydrogenophaga sp. BPS33]QHE86739.1 tripartite tricarboxylate transporter substrate binding protein [Hydrogenophaga sp. BPS33]